MNLTSVYKISDEAAARIGHHIVTIALKLGWNPEEGEGAYEYIQRLSYAQGLEDAGRLEQVGVRIFRSGRWCFAYSPKRPFSKAWEPIYVIKKEELES